MRGIKIIFSTGLHGASASGTRVYDDQEVSFKLYKGSTERKSSPISEAKKTQSTFALGLIEVM
jgi:hypothetical protein